MSQSEKKKQARILIDDNTDDSYWKTFQNVKENLVPRMSGMSSNNSLGTGHNRRSAGCLLVKKSSVDDNSTQ